MSEGTAELVPADKSLSIFDYGCCVPTSQAMWMTFAMFVLSALVIMGCCLFGVINRWLYKRRMRKKCEAMREKYKQEERFKREVDLKLKQIALRPNTGTVKKSTGDNNELLKKILLHKIALRGVKNAEFPMDNASKETMGNIQTAEKAFELNNVPNKLAGVIFTGSTPLDTSPTKSGQSEETPVDVTQKSFSSKRVKKNSVGSEDSTTSTFDPSTVDTTANGSTVASDSTQPLSPLTSETDLIGDKTTKNSDSSKNSSLDISSKLKSMLEQKDKEPKTSPTVYNIPKKPESMTNFPYFMVNTGTENQPSADYKSPQQTFASSKRSDPRLSWNTLRSSSASSYPSSHVFHKMPMFPQTTPAFTVQSEIPSVPPSAYDLRQIALEQSKNENMDEAEEVLKERRTRKKEAQPVRAIPIDEPPALVHRATPMKARDVRRIESP